jgi:hypothetical protein
MTLKALMKKSSKRRKKSTESTYKRYSTIKREACTKYKAIQEAKMILMGALRIRL